MLETARRWLAVARLATTTRALYELYLIQWLEWITDNHIPARRAKPHDLAGWLDTHPDWSDSTRHSACAAVRGFYRAQFGAKHKLLEFNVRRRDPGPQRTPDRATIEKVLASFDTTKPRGRCLLAMVVLMLDTGLRCAEVCGCELERLDMTRGLLWVRVKGGDWQPKRFFDYTRSCLAAWLAIRETIALPETKTVFCGCHGLNLGKTFGRSTLKTAFRRIGEQTGIGAFSPHDLRRAFATFATENGAPSRLVQEAGGWENIEMVERYTRAIDLERMRKYSPVDRLMGLPPDD
jgi:site-specific recombinase XerD